MILLTICMICSYLLVFAFGRYWQWAKDKENEAERIEFRRRYVSKQGVINNERLLR